MNIDFINNLYKNESVDSYPVFLVPNSIKNNFKEEFDISSYSNCLGQFGITPNNGTKSLKLINKVLDIVDKERGLVRPQGFKLKNDEKLDNDDPLYKYYTSVTGWFHHYLKREYFRSLNSSHLPERTGDIPQKGKTEIFFLEYLVNKFGDKILVDTKVGLYFPDFVYYDKEFNICIDIEIDEINTLQGKKPIHYKGVDDNRNQFFKENNWFVLRFSEKQILNQTDVVVDYIQLVIWIIHSFDIIERRKSGYHKWIKKEKIKTYEEILLELHKNPST